MDYNLFISKETAEEVIVCICIIRDNVPCFAWSDFSGDKGCFNPASMSKEEWARLSITQGIVYAVIKKGSELHKNLARKIANYLGKKFIGYDYLCKVISRILLCIDSHTELAYICSLSRVIQVFNNNT